MSAPNRFLPFLPLATPRLKIRAYHPQDLAATKPIHQGEGVRRWIGSGILSDPAHQTYVARNAGENPRGFIAEDRASATIVGEGAFRQCIPRPDGTWWDEVYYAVLADEWRSASR